MKIGRDHPEFLARWNALPVDTKRRLQRETPKRPVVNEDPPCTTHGRPVSDCFPCSFE